MRGLLLIAACMSFDMYGMLGRLKQILVKQKHFRVAPQVLSKRDECALEQWRAHETVRTLRAQEAAFLQQLNCPDSQKNLALRADLSFVQQEIAHVKRLAIKSTAQSV